MQSIVYDSLKTIVIIGDCGSNKTAFSECQKKLFQCRKNELAGVICQSIILFDVLFTKIAL